MQVRTEAILALLFVLYLPQVLILDYFIHQRERRTWKTNLLALVLGIPVVNVVVYLAFRLLRGGGGRRRLGEIG